MHRSSNGYKDPDLFSENRMNDIQLLSDGGPPVDWSLLDKICLVTMNNEKIPLKSLWNGTQRTVIVFLRRFDCATW